MDLSKMQVKRLKDMGSLEEEHDDNDDDLDIDYYDYDEIV